MATQVILLERIEKLGAMGDIVNVKPGYARNYLLPQNKALRATDSNIAYFETQKASLQQANNEKKKVAQEQAKNIKGLTVNLIRQAGEAGHLYGSVTARDIAEGINEASPQKVERHMIDLNQNYKEIGLYDVIVTLHAEVKETIKINIARTEDEAAKQLKTGKAVIGDDHGAPVEAANDSKEALMEEGAFKAEKDAEAKDAEKAAEASAKAEKKSEAKKAKKVEAAPVEGEEINEEAADA